MRITTAILPGSAAVLIAAILTAPVLASHSTPRKTNDTPSASSCHAYQQAADGSYKPLPCQEGGAGTSTQHRPSPHNEGDDAH